MTFSCVEQASIKGQTASDTVCVDVCVILMCLSFGSLNGVGHQRSEPGVCGADQCSASGAAAARTFCSAPTEDICYQLFISPYTTFLFTLEMYQAYSQCTLFWNFKRLD